MRMTSPTETPPRKDKGGPVPPAPPRWRHYLWLLAAAIFVVLFLSLPATTTRQHETLNYSQFLGDVAAKRVEAVTIGSDGTATGGLSNGRTYSTVIPAQAGQDLLTKLEAGDVQITAKAPGVSFTSQVLLWLLLLSPFLVFGFLWFRMSKGAAGSLQGVLGAGRSKPKVFDSERPSTTFADVAGYEGAKVEIREVVDFLRHAELYAVAGAKPPGACS
jgi:cell division protease FtsH